MGKIDELEWLIMVESTQSKQPVLIKNKKYTKKASPWVSDGSCHVVCLTDLYLRLKKKKNAPAIIEFVFNPFLPYVSF